MSRLGIQLEVTGVRSLRFAGLRLWVCRFRESLVVDATVPNIERKAISSSRYVILSKGYGCTWFNDKKALSFLDLQLPGSQPKLHLRDLRGSTPPEDITLIWTKVSRVYRGPKA